MTPLYRADNPDYMRAKRIRQATERVDPLFDAFLDEFKAEFGFAPLSLDIDVVVGAGGNGGMPRLGVVLERSEQCRSFRDASRNYDLAKQRAIAKMLMESVAETTLRQLFGRPLPTGRGTPFADEIFVYFKDFENMARLDAHESVKGAELDAFVEALALGDDFWCTMRFEGPPIVFVHTTEQAGALRALEVQDRWADEYFALAHRHDEFGYLRREEVSIAVDSKENFDLNYEGSWFYYFR